MQGARVLCGSPYGSRQGAGGAQGRLGLTDPGFGAFFWSGLTYFFVHDLGSSQLDCLVIFLDGYIPNNMLVICWELYVALRNMLTKQLRLLIWI